MDCAAVHGWLCKQGLTLEYVTYGTCVGMAEFTIIASTWTRRQIFFFVVVWLYSSIAPAAEVQVTVIDRDGAPVPGVAVYIESTGAGALPAPATGVVMDQVDTRFVPHLLVVQVGTEVEFPNSDIVAHHVYSFSNPNDFMLPLYKGDAHAPVTFDEAGVVTLGCNIHDNMLGYILVVDSNIFGKTGQDGQLTLEASPRGESNVKIWSPRIKDKGEVLTRSLTGASNRTVVFKLSEKLRPPHDSASGAIQWSDY